MCEDFISENNLENFEARAADFIRNVRSLDDITPWLQSHQYVAFVKLEEYVVKTFPPRREFTIGLKMKGGSIREKVVIIQVVDDDKFQFQNMREPN